MRRLLALGIVLHLVVIATFAQAEDKSAGINLADLKLEQMAGRSDQRLATAVGLPFTKRLPGPITDYVLAKTDGVWEHEYVMKCIALGKQGERMLQRGGRSGALVKPWIILFNRTTRRGICVMLAYSGNWAIDILPDGGGVAMTVRTSPAGVPQLDTLAGMPVPGALVSEFDGHWDYGTLPIRRFIREKLRRKVGKDWPPMQFNDWNLHGGNMSEPSLLKAARVAAEVGCELFTVDAGWYGVQSDWNKDVGDWRVNTHRLPHGIKPVSDEVRRLGMKFGMWIEIESAGPDSPVMKTHRDWALFDTPRYGRYVLNFGRPEVLQYAEKVVDDLVNDNGLDYLKIDLNTDPSAGSEQFTPDQDPLTGHYRGLLEFLHHLRSAHPALIVENCSGGSQRQDAMTAALYDTHWVSDNCRNDQNLTQNYGATHFFPPEICSHWTIAPDDAPAREVMDIESRFRVNMLGHFGLSGPICNWSKDTRRIAAREIALYKTIRSFLGKADVYHLTPPADFEHPASAVALQYLDPQSGRSLLFAFQDNDPALDQTFRLRELQPTTAYRIKTLTGAEPADITLKGRHLMHEGMSLHFPHKGASLILSIEPQAAN